MSTITLTTDFGLADGYVAAMKGVLLSIAPATRWVDISHAIPAQDVRAAAYVLYTTCAYFPPDTIHLAVVDPGVGTPRRGVAVCTPVGCFVGPDNGLFSYVLAEVGTWRAVALKNPAYHLPAVSATFHGRDVFAPAAAYLATGVALESLGPPVVDLVELPRPRLDVSGAYITGDVLRADRFGNLITGVGRLTWMGGDLLLSPAFRPPTAAPFQFPAHTVRVTVGGRELYGIRRTYGDAPVGDMVAIVGSAGFLEIAVHQGSAARELGVGAGEPVYIERLGEPRQ